MLEEGNVPGISGGERDGVEIADSLQDVFHNSPQLGGGHSRTLPFCSIRLVKSEGGVRGTTSNGTSSSFSSLAANSNSFQPGIPSHARSTSLASDGPVAALPNRISLVAPYLFARDTILSIFIAFPVTVISDTPYFVFLKVSSIIAYRKGYVTRPREGSWGQVLQSYIFPHPLPRLLLRACSPLSFNHYHVFLFSSRRISRSSTTGSSGGRVRDAHRHFFRGCFVSLLVVSPSFSPLVVALTGEAETRVNVGFFPLSIQFGSDVRVASA